MGMVVYSLLCVMQGLYHQPYLHSIPLFVVQIRRKLLAFVLDLSLIEAHVDITTLARFPRGARLARTKMVTERLHLRSASLVLG